MDGDKPYVTDNSNYIVDLYFKVGLSPLFPKEKGRKKEKKRKMN